MDAYGLNTSSFFLPKTTEDCPTGFGGHDDNCPIEATSTAFDDDAAGGGYVITSNSDKWLTLGIFTTTLYAAIYYNYDGKFLRQITNKQLAYFGLILGSFSFIPFGAYAMNGIAWTGLQLMEIQRKMIDQRHAVLMFGWVFLSTIQLLSYLSKQQTLHNAVGKFLMKFLLPIIFVELGTNAAFVFVPDKPTLAWQALNNHYHNHQHNSNSNNLYQNNSSMTLEYHQYTDNNNNDNDNNNNPTIPTIIAFMFTEAMALLTPLHMIMYWWLAWSAIAVVPTKTTTRMLEEDKKKDGNTTTTTTTSSTSTSITNTTNNNMEHVATTTSSTSKPKPKPKKDIRLHVVYSSLLMTTMSGAGILRWYMQREFWASGCPQGTSPNANRGISVLCQTIGHNWACFTYPILYLGLYCTLPLKQRQTNITLQYAFWFHLLTSTFLGPIASYIMNIPGSIICLPPGSSNF